MANNNLRGPLLPVPEFVKNVFNRFPLTTFEAPNLPSSAVYEGRVNISKPCLYIGEQDIDEKDKLSTNPEALRWQVSLIPPPHLF